MKGESFHHGNLRAALIEAGLAAVEARGAGEVSLRDLARQVGVSPTAAYRHFADKDALFTAIADRGFRRLAEVSAAALRPGDPRARLVALGHAYVGFARENPSLYRLMFSEPLDMARLARESEGSAAAYLPLRRAVEAVLGPDADEARIIDGVVFFWSVVHGYATLRLANRLPVLATVEDRADQLLQAAAAAL